jgi:hypothetical protein
MTLQEESSSESTPLIVRDIEHKNNHGENERGAKFYQAVIDDAHKLVPKASYFHFQ